MFLLPCVFALVGLSVAADMPQLYAKYSMTGTPGTDCFFAPPRTAKEAVAANWTIPEETIGDQKLFTTYCNPKDYRICVLIDAKGSICGYQISIPREVDSLKIPGFNYTQKGFKSLTLFGQEMYSNQIYFVSQDVIKSGGRDFNGQTGDGLYLQVGEQLLQVPLSEAGMNTTKFNRQNCFVRMGQHYFYDVRPTITPEEFMPWFTLFDPTGKLFGFGFLAYGSIAKLEKTPYVEIDDASSWLENVPALAIKMIAPDVPDWVLEYVDKYGLYSHHVYFGNEPWKITCSDNKLAGKKY